MIESCQRRNHRVRAWVIGGSVTMLAGLIAAITGFIMLMDIMLTPIDRRGWLLIIGGVILGALGFGMHVKAGMIDGQPEGASHDIADR